MHLPNLLQRLSHKHKTSCYQVRFKKLGKEECLDDGLKKGTYQETINIDENTSIDDQVKNHKWKPPNQADGDGRRARAPRGYLPICVCVGHDEPKRYLIKAKHLNHPLFLDLLERTAQEYGYSHRGILKIVCDVEALEKILASSSQICPWEVKSLLCKRSYR